MKSSVQKLKFLAVKLSALESELDISRQILQTVTKEVGQMFDDKYFSERRVGEDEADEAEEDKPITEYQENEEQTVSSEDEEESEEQPKQEIEQEKIEKDPKVKKLFKKIAAKIHPDKIENLEGFEKDKKTSLYKKAVMAMEKNDIVLLADVALELDMEVPEISSEKLKETENKIIAIKKELHHIESTYVWQWFFCEDEQIKDKILEQLFGIMYEQNYGVRP